jgi:hypothetical protein
MIFITKWEPTTAGSPPGSGARVNFQIASPNSPVTNIQARLNGQLVGEPIAGRRSGGIWFDTPTVPGTYVVTVEATNAYGCTAVQGKNALGQALTVVVQ